MEYLEVQVKIPTNLDISIKNEIYSDITSLPCIALKERLVTDNIFKYYFNVLDINLAPHIEELFDKYIHLKVQYNYLLYQLTKKYPSSVRINRNGKKIYTKNQTKILYI